MIEVEVLRDDEGRVQEFRCYGEAEETESEVSLTVEAGVTTLIHTAKIGLERYLKLEPQVEDEPNRLALKLKRDHLLNREIDAMMETVLLGLKAIEQRYPSHLAVKETGDRVKV